MQSEPVINEMIFSLLHDWFGWDNGSVLTNLIASFFGLLAGYMIALYHMKCAHCLRPARIPVKGTTHHVCKKHATQYGHTH